MPAGLAEAGVPHRDARPEALSAREFAVPFGGATWLAGPTDTDAEPVSAVSAAAIACGPASDSPSTNAVAPTRNPLLNTDICPPNAVLPIT